MRATQGVAPGNQGGLVTIATGDLFAHLPGEIEINRHTFNLNIDVLHERLPATTAVHSRAASLLKLFLSRPFFTIALS